MKTLFIGLIALMLLNASCKKCAECTRVTTFSTFPSRSGYPYTTVEHFTACGSELREVDGNDATVNVTNGNTTYITTSKTECVDR